jgi:hypothetical protein
MEVVLFCLFQLMVKGIIVIVNGKEYFILFVNWGYGLFKVIKCLLHYALFHV